MSVRSKLNEEQTIYFNISLSLSHTRCVFMYVCMYICIDMRSLQLRQYKLTKKWLVTHARIHTHIHMHTHARIHTHTYISTYIHIHVHPHTYAYTYTYTYTYRRVNALMTIRTRMVKQVEVRRNQIVKIRTLMSKRMRNKRVFQVCMCMCMCMCMCV